MSPQAADLVRRIARLIPDEPADLMTAVQAAVLAAADEPLRSQPTLAAEVAASTRSNVPPTPAGPRRAGAGQPQPRGAGIARGAFRQGIEQTVYTTYHGGQNAVWGYWMRTAFWLSLDPAMLRQTLETARRRCRPSLMTWCRRCRSSCDASARIGPQ